MPTTPPENVRSDPATPPENSPPGTDPATRLYTTSGGGADLTIGAWASGELLKRTGASTAAGVAASAVTGVGGVTVDAAGENVAATFAAITDGNLVKRSGTTFVSLTPAAAIANATDAASAITQLNLLLAANRTAKIVAP